MMTEYGHIVLINLAAAAIKESLLMQYAQKLTLKFVDK